MSPNPEFVCGFRELKLRSSYWQPSTTPTELSHQSTFWVFAMRHLKDWGRWGQVKRWNLNKCTPAQGTKGQIFWGWGEIESSREVASRWDPRILSILHRARKKECSKPKGPQAKCLLGPVCRLPCVGEFTVVRRPQGSWESVSQEERAGLEGLHNPIKGWNLNPRQ